MFLYKHAKQSPVQGYALTLTGTEPKAELSLLRDYLNWPANRTWFVDKDKSKEVSRAVSFLKREWDGVNTSRDDLRSVVPRLEAIGFANLDFMGAPLKDESVDCLRVVIPHLLPGAVLGFTWFRGRELPNHSSEIRLSSISHGFHGNERRWVGVLRTIDEISRGRLKLLGGWEYFSKHSPMSVAVFKTAKSLQ